MLIGLRNAPETSGQALDVASSSYLWEDVPAYTDDVVAVPSMPAKPADHIRSVLTLPSDTGVSLKLVAFEFFSIFINYFRLLIRWRGSEIASHSSGNIRALEASTLAMELKSV